MYYFNCGAVQLQPTHLQPTAVRMLYHLLYFIQQNILQYYTVPEQYNASTQYQYGTAVLAYFALKGTQTKRSATRVRVRNNPQKKT